MQKKIGNLQSLRQRLSEPFIKGNPSIVTLKTVVSELKKEIDELTGTTITKKAKKTVPMASKAEHDFAIGNALSYEKDKLKKQVLDLQAKLKGLESGVIEPVEKKIVKTISEQSGRYNANDIVNMAMRGVDKDLSIKDMITSIDSSIFKLTNEMNEKYHLLDNVLQSKSVAKGIIDKAFKTKNFESLPDDVARALQPTSNDPKVMEAIKERLTRNAEVAMKAEIEDPYAVYAPHIRKDITEHDRILEFFQGTRRLGIGSENYKKEFRNLLKDDELLRDRTLFLRVEDQVATNAVKKQFMVDTVKQFGEPLTAFRNEKAAEKAGYVLLKEKGMFGKEVGYLLKNDFDFINGKVTQQFGALDAIAKATGFDTLNSLFKRFVTGPFASFYVRNFASGKMQNYEVIGYHALLPQTLANGARVANRISRGAYTDIEDFFKAGTKLNKGVEKFKNEFIEIPGGKKMMLDDIAKAITERFAHSTFYNNDYNALVRDADILLDSGAWSKETLKHTGKVALDWKRGGPIGALISENNPFWKTGRVIGNYIELNQKSDVVIGALYKGHTLDEALDLAEKAGFDYSKLTQFESKVMRRIIPFYTFTRKNIGLQLKTLGTNPQRINHIARTIQGAQSLFEQELSDEDKKYLPTYLREAFSVSAGKNSEGAAVFVQGFGTPIEAFTSLVKQSADGKSTFQRTFLGTLNLVTPYIKAPVEMAFGKDTFRMQDIKDVYNAKEYRDAPQFIKDYLKLKPVKKKTADGKEYTVYAADPENYHVMRSLFTHRGFTYFSNVFNEDLPGFLRIMEAMSGVRSEDVNLDYYRGLSERRQEEEIGDMLRRYGIVGEFNKLFIPKENK
jgi:polyhydroxyalkanoate synthesis regulator phasin